MSKTVVDFDNVSLVYHERTNETNAISHLSFSVDEGEFVSIVGPSGCGKTSVLSLVAGLISPSEGKVSVFSNKPGYMLQRDHLLDWRSVYGNVLLGLEVKKAVNETSINEVLELLKSYGLYDFKDSFPRQLSGGMRQRVALIRTLATKPDILLLDEPFSSLDYQTRLKVADEIYSILKQEGKTVILVTHDISEAISMSDRVIVFSKRPATLKKDYKIEISGSLTPLQRRNSPLFKDYFDLIWKELDKNEN